MGRNTDGGYLTSTPRRTGPVRRALTYPPTPTESNIHTPYNTPESSPDSSGMETPYKLNFELSFSASSESDDDMPYHISFTTRQEVINNALAGSTLFPTASIRGLSDLVRLTSVIRRKCADHKRSSVTTSAFN